MPSAGQIVVVVLSIMMFLIGGGISLSRLWIEKPWSRLGAKVCMYLGLLIALVAQIWHGAARGSMWPLENNFDSLIWLAMGLALFVMYVQKRKPLAGLDWFVMPIVVLLLVGAAITGRTNWKTYPESLWIWVHLAGVFGGTAVFAVAGAAGCMYLISNRRLRNKMALAGPNLGSLERLEHLTFSAVTLGFALLTIGGVTGLFWLMRHKESALPTTKIVMFSAVWLVYAIVLHSPINPSFRGRRAAILSIVGFVLMVGTVVAVLVMPASG